MATKVNPVTGALDYYEQALPSFRNKIHNGAMQIAQRATSTNFAYNGTTNGYVLDRFRIYTNNLQNWAGTVSQHTMSSSDYNTTGFSNALKFLTTNPETTIDNNEYARIDTKLEGQDVKNLQYGTASAKSSTLSFWVNSSVTGTYGITFYSQCSQARALNVTYTIDSANTWEHKTITIVGDTAEAHTDDNTLGIMIVWSLASGSNYDSVNSTSWANYTTTNLNGGHQQDGVVTTDDAVFYLTGVQWEIGTSSTPFEHRPHSLEKSLCQRYFQKVDGRSHAYRRDDTLCTCFMTLPQCMRLKVPVLRNITKGALSNMQNLPYGTINDNTIAAGAECEMIDRGFLYIEFTTNNSGHTFIPSWQEFNFDVDAEL